MQLFCLLSSQVHKRVDHIEGAGPNVDLSYIKNQKFWPKLRMADGRIWRQTGEWQIDGKYTLWTYFPIQYKGAHKSDQRLLNKFHFMSLHKLNIGHFHQATFYVAKNQITLGDYTSSLICIGISHPGV